jgi:hypothetical protein
VTWAAKSSDPGRVAADAAREGVKLGPVIPGSRKRADGVMLSWRYTDPRTVVADGLVPFFIDWGTTPHPAATAATGARLVALRAEHPDPARIQKMLTHLAPGLPVRQAASPALVATISGPHGQVELR